MNGTNYQNHYLDLKSNIFFVILTDPDNNNKAVGKIISPNNNRHFKVNNSTTAHLLYLLSRAGNTEIKFESMKDLIKQKYGLDDATATSELNNFLNKLDTAPFNILESKTHGNEPNDPAELDPCGLFNIPAAWEAPGLTDFSNNHPAKFQGEHFFGCGNAAYSFRR